MVKLEEPDKGRAWVIAFSACIINMILSGLSRMIGILYVAVIEDYGVTRQEATLPFTVRNSIRMLSGPMVGVIGQRFGIREVTFWGGVVASAGAALCYIAPNITWIAIFWGGIHGCGFAFANTLFQVVVNQYFEKYRVTASGIALSGACVGSLAFPFMIEAILDTYGLKGGFLILGGIVMHVLPLSLMLNSPQWIRYPKEYARQWALQHSGESVESVNSVVHNNLSNDDNLTTDEKLARSGSFSDCPVEEVIASSISRQQSRQEGEKYSIEKFVNEVNETDMRFSAVICTLYKTNESPMLNRKNVDQNSEQGVVQQGISVPTINVEDQSPPANHLKIEDQTKNTISQNIKDMISLYKSPPYLMISICMSTYILIFIPILTCIVDYGIDKGMPENAGKYLINAMAIGDLIGRLGFGWVTDKRYMSISSFMTVAMIFQGAFIALFPISDSMAVFVVLLMLYGITAGAILVLFPVLVLQYVDLRVQSIGMANAGFISGILSFGIPPMIGHYRDEVGSYDGMFYLTGIISVLSGGLWLLEPVVRRRFGNARQDDNNVALKQSTQATTLQNNMRHLNVEDERRNHGS